MKWQLSSIKGKSVCFTVVRRKNKTYRWFNVCCNNVALDVAESWGVSKYYGVVIEIMLDKTLKKIEPIEKKSQLFIT